MEPTMQSGMTAKIAAADVDPFALQQPPVAPHRSRRRTLIFVVTGLIAYLIGLIALIPAKAVVDERDGLQVGGTIWNGQAVLGSTLRFDWQFAPVATLTRLGFGADWHLSGGGTDLAGSLTSRGAVLRFDKVSGQADGTLLSALAPRLPFTCRFIADVAMERIVLGGSAQEALGNFRTSPANCALRAIAAPPVELPAMRADVTPGARGSSGALMTAAGQLHLIELRLAPTGALSIWSTSNAVQRVPFFAGMRYDTVIEKPV